MFAWEWLKPVVAQLCQALDYAHGEGVVHRDLKPANMMLDSRGRLKLADFGLAATISDSLNRVSLDRGISGTPAYMSPQQMDGRPPQATDDIYALGATLYELLTSKPPFHSGDVLHQARNFTPDSLAQRQTEFGITNPVPADVSALIMACLAKDAAQRPQSAGAVAEFVGLETASQLIGLSTMAVGSESRDPYACASEPTIAAGTEGNEATPASGTKVGGTPRWLWVGFTAGAVVLAVVTTVVLIRGRGKDKNAVTQLQSPSLAGKSSAAARPVAFDFATKGLPQSFDAKGGVPVPNAARLQPLPVPGGPTQATSVPTVSAPAISRGKETNTTALKYESLWNGKNLSNWQGDGQFWSVKDGLLIGRKSSPGKALLTWAGGPVDDFELVLIYRTQGDGVAYLGYRFDENAGKTSEICGFGVYANDLISRSKSAQGVVTNIIPAGEFFYFWKSTSEGVGIGRFGRLPEQLQQLRQRLANGEVLPTDRTTTASPVSDKSDGWQELVVSAKGDRLTHWVNGRLSAAIKLGAPTTTRAVAVDSGSIMLEYSSGWGKPFEIQFKEIRLTRLR